MGRKLFVPLFFVALLTLCGHSFAANPDWPCAPGTDPRTCTPDDPYFVNDWKKWSYIPDELLDQVRPEEIPVGTGLGLDRAWQYSTGGPDVVIAVCDSGIYWNNSELVNMFYLNTGELPLPEGSPAYDTNGDGRVNVQDYSSDSRVSDTNSNGVIDPEDLIAAFSDGADDDGNAYADDICGWDFFWNDNNPYDDVRNGHGNGEARMSSSQGNNGRGGIGSCPNCAVMPLRISDSFIGDAAHAGLAIAYAADNDVALCQIAIGSVNFHPIFEQAVAYAYYKGIPVVGSAGDETSFHHELPGSGPRVILSNAIQCNAGDWRDATSFVNIHNCTNWGPRITFSISATSCSSEATGIMSGAMGVLVGCSRAAGLDPPMTADEARQVLISTAFDIYVPESAWDPELYESRPGPDYHFGYGRPNMGEACRAIFSGEIPPEAEILEPRWFAPFNRLEQNEITVRGRAAAPRSVMDFWLLEAAEGAVPGDEDFAVLAQGGAKDPVEAVLDLGGLDLPAAPFPDDPEAWTVTLRIRAVDVEGRVGTDRRVITVLNDPDLLPGFPLSLDGASGDSSPHLVDVDGDGDQEILLATTDGRVHLFQHDGSEMQGWPVLLEPMVHLDPDNPDNHLAAEAYTSGAVDADHAASIIGTVAAADVDNDGRIEIAVTSMERWVYLLSDDGEYEPGWPVEMDPANYAVNDPDHRIEDGFFASPALWDLDGDGDLEIIAAGLDSHVYAWKPDGSSLAGWPVLCSDPVYGQWWRILSTPAVGDINGDGSPDVVVGTTETYDDIFGRVYAIQADGNLNAGGPYLPNWPIEPAGYSGVLPYIGEGTPSSASLADLDFDGAPEVGIQTGISFGTIFNGEGYPFNYMSIFGFGPESNSSEPAAMPVINNSSFADINGDMLLDYITTGLGPRFLLAAGIPYKRFEFEHALMAWDSISGDFLDAFPRAVEDWQFLVAPSVADISGDMLPEVIGGSGGYLLHATDINGLEPRGWPKSTGGWIVGGAAIGDIDGDGWLEVVVPIREGYLFAWTTGGVASQAIQWKGYQHDPMNTGNFHTPLERQDGPGDADDDDDDDDSGGIDDDGEDDDDAGGNCGCLI